MPKDIESIPEATSDQLKPANDPALDQSRLLGLLGYKLRRAYLQILWLWADRMARLKLRPAEFSVLVLIASNPSVNQKRLGRALAIEPPNMATMLDRLEARDLLKRQRNPEDKRSQLLVLTPAGQRLCSKAEKAASDLELEASAKLSVAERDELARLLQKMFLG